MLLATDVAWATRDGGVRCELMATSQDSRHAVYAEVSELEGDASIFLVDIRTGAKTLLDFPYDSYGKPVVPAGLVKKYDLVAPPEPQRCSPDGRYCLRATSCIAIDLVTAEGISRVPPSESALAAVNKELDFLLEGVDDGDNNPNYSKKFESFSHCEALGSYWLGDNFTLYLALVGYYQLGEDWANTSSHSVCEFIKLPNTAKLDRTKTAHLFNDTGMEFYRTALMETASMYFSLAESLDPKYAQAIYNGACVHCLTGGTKEAVGQLKKLQTLGSRAALRKLKKAKKDSDFDKCRADPEFQKLTGKP